MRNEEVERHLGLQLTAEPHPLLELIPDQRGIVSRALSSVSELN